MKRNVRLSPEVREQLHALRKRDQNILVDAIEDNLVHQADQPARNRKKLQGSEIATWELRVGDFRVFYDVDSEEGFVDVVAVGRKTHNILRIGDEEVKHEGRSSGED